MNANFRSFNARLNHALILGLAAATLLACAARAGEFKPTWIESGMQTHMRGYRPMSIVLSNDAPAALKQGPDQLTAPLYGLFQSGPDKAPISHPVIMVAQDNVPRKLFVDANADGEITKDEAFDWTGKEIEKT